jgi:hypothetical protein
LPDLPEDPTWNVAYINPDPSSGLHAGRDG